MIFQFSRIPNLRHHFFTEIQEFWNFAKNMTISDLAENWYRGVSGCVQSENRDKNFVARLFVPENGLQSAKNWGFGAGSKIHPMNAGNMLDGWGKVGCRSIRHDKANKHATYIIHELPWKFRQKQQNPSKCNRFCMCLESFCWFCLNFQGNSWIIYGADLFTLSRRIQRYPTWPYPSSTLPVFIGRACDPAPKLQSLAF